MDTRGFFQCATPHTPHTTTHTTTTQNNTQQHTETDRQTGTEKTREGKTRNRRRQDGRQEKREEKRRDKMKENRREIRLWMSGFPLVQNYQTLEQFRIFKITITNPESILIFPDFLFVRMQMKLFFSRINLVIILASMVIHSHLFFGGTLKGSRASCDMQVIHSLWRVVGTLKGQQLSFMVAH